MCSDEFWKCLLKTQIWREAEDCSKDEDQRQESSDHHYVDSLVRRTIKLIIVKDEDETERAKLRLVR